MEKKEYDYLLVGAGLFNAIFAYKAAIDGKKCLVVEKRSHIGGNVYTENIEGINVHKYGAHIFHTRNKDVWNFMQTLCQFNHFINSPLAKYKDKIYNLPFNMNTFCQLWNVKTPEEARIKIESQRLNIHNPKNAEEQALNLVGEDIYYKFIKGYTEKQWGAEATKLPAFIINRIPLRYTFNNNYFDDPYQGIPVGGYTPIIKKCFSHSEVLLNTNFIENRLLSKLAKDIIYTGTIDEYYDYRYGLLEYRSLNFEERLLKQDNFQGNAVINYTDKDVPYTRILEHKHFEFGEQTQTVISIEYPCQWIRGAEAYYPINTKRNNALYAKYKELSDRETNIYFAGRLGSYQYNDMDKTVDNALTLYKMLSW
ncbi:UDP-galactopyranose mutase [Dysgonomonas termitidis]|uniref:UDP-galactopyranose mutase n=1 Tax=Dysgonomonas termitidis TaxID=1516126 RepID=A0ABV9KSV8_9BACT